jgi:hypothetical protein
VIGYSFAHLHLTEPAIQERQQLPQDAGTGLQTLQQWQKRSLQLYNYNPADCTTLLLLMALCTALMPPMMLLH